MNYELIKHGGRLVTMTEHGPLYFERYQDFVDFKNSQRLLRLKRDLTYGKGRVK